MSQDAILKVLKAQVVPLLRERGFSGSFPHFRRIQTDRIDLLSFQFDKYGGGFVIELAKSLPTGIQMSWGELIPPTKVTTQHVNVRLRLGAKGENEDYWFRYDKGQTCEEVALQIIPLFDTQGETWLATRGAV